jgi:predicted methyltransferase
VPEVQLPDGEMEPCGRTQPDINTAAKAAANKTKTTGTRIVTTCQGIGARAYKKRLPQARQSALTRGVFRREN